MGSETPRSGNSLFSPNGSWDHEGMADAIEALKTAGWTRVFNDGFYQLVTRADKTWPIRIDKSDGKIQIGQDDSAPFVDGFAQIEQALKSSGWKFTYRGSEDDAVFQGNAHFFTIPKAKNPGVTKGAVVKLVEKAVDSFVNVTRPSFIDNPWTKLGKTKIFPGQNNSYRVKIGNIEWDIDQSYDKADWTISTTLGDTQRIRTTK